MWVGKLPGRTRNVTSVAFAPDSRTIYTGDSAGRVLAWDVTTHESELLCRREKPKGGGQPGVYTLWPTPDGKQLLLADGLSLRDVLQPKAPPLITATTESWGDWRYLLPNGKHVISCEPQWRIGLWDLETGKRLPVPGELGKAEEITYHYLLPDGVTLLTYYTVNNALPLWNFHTGEKIGKLTPTAFGINPCAMAIDGNTFVVGRDKTLWVYDIPSRKLRHKLKSKNHIAELAFHPGGRLVASASNDSSLVILWDSHTGTQLTQFDWKPGKVEALAFAPDGLTCAIAGKSLIVFDIDL